MSLPTHIELCTLDDGSLFVSPSEFVDARRVKGSRLDSRVRDIPVLRGFFDASHVDLTPGAPKGCGWGSAEVGGIQLLTFYVKVSDDVLLWLADASDPCVWEALDKWRNAKKAALAARFAENKVLMIKTDYDPDEGPGIQRRSATRNASSREEFARLMLRLGTDDNLEVLAAHILGSNAQLGRVQYCMVCTAETPRLYLHNVVGLLPPQVAAAVRCTAMPVARPTGAKH